MTEHVIVNGTPYEYRPELAIDELITELLPQREPTAAGDAPTGVAVAVNDLVVPRGRWSQVTLAAGDRIEIVTAVQGG